MAQWMDASTWVALAEAARDPAQVPDYQRAHLGHVDQAPVTRAGRRRLTDDQYREAADRARQLGNVREVARQLGVPHPTLLSGWRRLGIVVRT